MTFPCQVIVVNGRVRARLSGPQCMHFSLAWSPAHPELPKSRREGWDAAGQPRVPLRTHCSPTSPVTGPTAAAPCTAQAGSSCRALPTGSRSAGLCLVSCPDHPPPTLPMGDTASPRPCHPADLRPCPRLPSTSTPQMGQHLCHFNIGTRWTSCPQRSHSPLRVKTSGRKVPRCPRESIS